VHTCIPPTPASAPPTYPLTWTFLSGWGDSNSRPLDPQKKRSCPSQPGSVRIGLFCTDRSPHSPVIPTESSEFWDFCIHFTYITQGPSTVSQGGQPKTVQPRWRSGRWGVRKPQPTALAQPGSNSSSLTREMPLTLFANTAWYLPITSAYSKFTLARG